MEHFIQWNVPLRHLLNVKTQFISWQRSAFNEVLKWLGPTWRVRNNNLVIRISMIKLRKYLNIYVSKELMKTYETKLGLKVLILSGINVCPILKAAAAKALLTL